MPIFKYRAKKDSGVIVDGKVEARTETEAIEKLGQIGYLPIRIEQEGKAAEQKARTSAARTAPRIASRSITVFSRELASMIRSGVPILSAIDIISEQSEDQRLKDVLRDIHGSIRDGESFSSALSQYPKIFSGLYVAMVRAGENSGALAEALIKVSEHRVKQEEVMSKLKMASIYPMLMGVVGLGTVIFMLIFVMPRLMQVFVRLGQDLPVPTQILISVSLALRAQWKAILLAVLVIMLILRGQTQTRAGKMSLGVIRLRLPILGRFVLKAELSRFCRTLELLIRNGIPILKAINIAIPVLDNEVIKDQLSQSYKDLEQGNSFGRSLKGAPLFPLFMSNLVIVGEESGRLDDALAEIASSYERDVDEAVKIIGNLLEPLMILVMGLVVGFIVMAMLLPVFSINM